MSASAKNIYQYGSTGIAVPSTISGQNVNQSCLAWKSFSPIVLSSTKATQLPNCPCMNAKICSQLGNDLIAVGGLSGSNDDPYFFPNNPGLARGTIIPPGQCHIFKITNTNLLTVISVRGGDIVTLQACLSMTDFATSTVDPGPNQTVHPTPTVLSVTPANNSSLVSINKDIVAVMNTPVTGVDSTVVFLKRHSDGLLIPGVVTLAGDNVTITFNPTNNLTTDTQYDFTIENLENNIGIIQSPNPFISTFTTAGNLWIKGVTEALGSVAESVKKKTSKFVSEAIGSIAESVAVKSTQLVYNVAQDAVTHPSCSPVSGAGYSCYVNTAGFYAQGEIASVSNGLVGTVITKVVVAKAKSQTGSSGTVGCIIVNAAASIVYTFSSTQSVGAATGPFTLSDTNNTYVMAAGDCILLTWNQGSSNGLAVSINSTGPPFGGGVKYNGASFGADASCDLAVQISGLV